MTERGGIAALWLKRAKGAPMEPVMFAEAIASSGIAANANQGGRRQVTILDESRWLEATAEAGATLDPSARRANVLTRGIDLERSAGRLLRLGPVVIRIEGETEPCHQMDDAWEGLRAALVPRWRGGAYGVVLTGGVMRVGDPAEWIQASEHESR